MKRRERKIKTRGWPFDPPTESEIANARDEVYSNESIELKQLKGMGAWEGMGWHKDEVYYGILVGLQIAKNREVKNGQTPNNAR